MSETKGSPPPTNAAAGKTQRPSTLLIVGGVVAVCVVALALGLGLGLGLRNRDSSAAGPSPSATSTAPPVASGSPLPGSGGTGSSALEDWRLDTKEYVLDVKWDLNAAPTTRKYDLVITEGQGWPDGTP